MPVWNIIRTLSGRGEFFPGPLPSSAIENTRKKNKEDELFEETDPVDMIPGTESVRKAKKVRKGKGKEKDARHQKLPSEERTSKSLKDAQKVNAEKWREQREAKEQTAANRKGNTVPQRETRWLGLRRGIT